MATFKKTLTMSLNINSLDRNGLSSDENSVANEVLDGSKGYLLKTSWNTVHCWNNIDLGKTIVNDEPLYLSSSINIDDNESNQMIHAVTLFIGAQSSKSNTIEDVLANSISFTQSLKIELHHQGEDLWTANFTIDLRNVSQSVYTAFTDLYGANETIVTFKEDKLIEEVLEFGSLYQASKTFTWDRISTLSATMSNKSIGGGSLHEIITYSIS
jgi:hypothetical protein